MPWHTLTPFYIWLATTIIFTVVFWPWKPKDKLTAITLLLIYILFHVYCFFTVNWVLANYYLIILPPILSIVMLIRTLRKFRYSTILGQEPVPNLPHGSRSHQIALAIGFIFLAGLIWLNYGVTRSFFYKEDPFLLFLPVRNGMYAITNGGNGADGFGMNNYLRNWFGIEIPDADPALTYSADIYKLKALGNPIEQSSAPNPLADYAIFNDIVSAPCFGEVIMIEDGHPDVAPYAETDTQWGNFIVVRCQDGYVTLANLKANSVFVEEGQSVRPPMTLAYVGNSGQPSIPHLHVHVTRGSYTDGEPTPILFDGWFSVNQFPVRNKFFLP